MLIFLVKSVTRWIEYFSFFGHLQQLKIAQEIAIVEAGFKFLQNSK